MVSNKSFGNNKITFCYYNEQEFRDFIKENGLSETKNLLKTMQKIELYGLAIALRQKWVKKIRHKKTNLFEIRAKGNKTIQRAIFFKYINGSYVVTHAFVKKTQKLPKKEIDKAISRKKKY